MRDGQFGHLLSPLRIGGIEVRNRVFSSAHGTGFSTDGLLNERHKAYHLERARGGIGLIVIEATSVDDSPIAASVTRTTLRNLDDSVIPNYRDFAETIRAAGARVFCLLSHSGCNTVMGKDGEPPLAPSPIPMDRTRDVPHQLEVEEINAIVEGFAAAARRCRQGGLDGIELSFTHGNLVQEFLSPLSNRRDDEYGGAEENRLRLAREVLRACRDAVGPDFVLGVRYTADELVPGGYTLADGVRWAPRLVEWGGLDFLDVSAGTNSSMWSRSRHYPTIASPARPLVAYARAIKDAVGVPVFCVGKIADPREAEAIVAAGDADMVAMTRAHIAEPEIVRKVEEGRLDDIRTCIYCNESCFGRQQRVGDISCVYNPRTGRESAWEPLANAGRPRKVLVVGGGPSGLEAARVAARRGHQVVLHERADHLGGQLALIPTTPHRSGYGTILAWYQHQLDQLGVDLRLGSQVDATLALASGAEVVVVATGSADEKPAIDGADLPHVVTAREVLLEDRLGGRVLVCDWDGRHMGMSVAEYLAIRGHQVELVSPAFFVGMDVDLLTWHPAYERLLNLGVRMSALEELVAVEDGAGLVRALNGATRKVDADGFVLCSRGRADRDLYRQLHGRVPELHAVGDCWAPRQLEQAIFEGARVARAI